MEGAGDGGSPLAGARGLDGLSRPKAGWSGRKRGRPLRGCFMMEGLPGGRGIAREMSGTGEASMSDGGSGPSRDSRWRLPVPGRGSDQDLAPDDDWDGPAADPGGQYRPAGRGDSQFGRDGDTRYGGDPRAAGRDGPGRGAGLDPRLSPPRDPRGDPRAAGRSVPGADLGADPRSGLGPPQIGRAH